MNFKFNAFTLLYNYRVQIELGQHEFNAFTLLTTNWVQIELGQYELIEINSFTLLTTTANFKGKTCKSHVHTCIYIYN